MLFKDALAIAARCEYGLKQANSHTFLGQMALDEGDIETAQKEAQMAFEWAWCDGSPHCYKPNLNEAERLLKELGVRPPNPGDLAVCTRPGVLSGNCDLHMKKAVSGVCEARTEKEK